MENIEITKPMQPHTITFKIDEEEIIKITKGRFYWKGKEVEDARQVHERFSEWLKEQGM